MEVDRTNGLYKGMPMFFKECSLISHLCDQGSTTRGKGNADISLSSM